MRRSLCVTEPLSAYAGDVSNWKFIYTPAADLPKGTKIKFDLLTKGRPIDWEVPSANENDGANLIWAKTEKGKAIYPVEVSSMEGYANAFEFTLPSEIVAGDPLTIFLGCTDNKKEDIEENGNRAQTIIQRRKPFHLYVDPKGKGTYKDPEIFTLDIRGNVLSNICIIAPSLVSKNRRFDIIVRFEDAFGNLTNNAPEDTLIELSYDNLRENLNWKLFVPETGFLTLPNIYFNEAGIYKIKLVNPSTNQTFYSSPILCTQEAEKGIYWGLLHGESERFDSLENIESCLRHFRDECALHFFASSSFESAEETPNDNWKEISQQLSELNEEARFCTMHGFQWHDFEDPSVGLRQFVYFKDNKPILRKKDAKSNSLTKIYKSHTPKDFLSIPSFSMAKGMECNFEKFDPTYEKVVEIYNAWGCSECTVKEGNIFPISSDTKNGVFESASGSIREALNRNCRFGFVAGGLDDRGVYADFYDSDQIQYTPGITAVLAIEQTREALMLAIQNRSCYATTGERIILGFFLAGAQMGSELNSHVKPGLTMNRHLSGYVAGTAPLKEISIIRNGKTLHTFSSENPYFEFAHDDMEELSKIVLESPDERPPFAYYYLRVLQEDGHMAWSSPIWVDMTKGEAVIPAKKGKRAKTK